MSAFWEEDEFWEEARRLAARPRDNRPPRPARPRPRPAPEDYERAPRRSPKRAVRQERHDRHLHESYRFLLNEVLRAQESLPADQVAPHLVFWISKQIHDLEKI